MTRLPHDTRLSHLGQSGFILEIAGDAIYVDPYLSDSVERYAGLDMRRLRPSPVQPQQVTRANAVLITHAHLDHCDPDTLRLIAKQCPECRFVGPGEVAAVLESQIGLDPVRMIHAHGSPFELPSGAVVYSVPAAHRELECDALGRPRCVGFIVEFQGRRLYHSGDCSVHPDVTGAVRKFGRIDTALLPVNECNYYRDRRGIVGNMSVREAFAYAEEIGAERVVPMHYDMFAPNCVYEDEILVVYRNLQPRFQLEMPRDEMELWHR
jgi:L-ascorbate 6-phosphate lactonase